MNTFTIEYARILDFLIKLSQKSVQDTFDTRWHILELSYSVEDLLARNREVRPAPHVYCFYVNQKGIRYLLLNDRESVVALKLKWDHTLSDEEKQVAQRIFKGLLSREPLNPEWLQSIPLLS